MSDNNKSKLKLNLDMRLIIVALLVIIAGMLLMWKPWDNASASGRTITVSGEAKITAEPDEFTFMPSYEFKDANKDAALAALTAKSDEIVKKLKELGVASSKIKINSDGYDYRNYYLDSTSNEFTYSLRPTIKVGKGDLVQKVQDYLVTTSPSGQVSPIADFSTTYKKVLQDKARDEATKDARDKAERSAKNLGFKVGKVKSVDDNNSMGGIMPSTMMGTATDSAEAKPMSLSVQPGENDLTFTVTVVYYVK